MWRFNLIKISLNRLSSIIENKNKWISRQKILIIYIIDISLI